MVQEPNLIPKLFGTAMTWFLFDVLFYGNTLFQPIVIKAALPGYAVAGFVMRSTKITTTTSDTTKSTMLSKLSSLILYQSPRYVMLQVFFTMTILLYYWYTMGFNTTWTTNKCITCIVRVNIFLQIMDQKQVHLFYHH
jgi:hypothetical protein